ncbi:MAG TPA: hypothetical protein VIJ79_03620 [Acidobacteriaceae bacterium]
MRKFDEVQDEFEQELGRRMRRVDPPEGFAERLLERAAAQTPLRAKVLTMPRRTVFRAWVGGAIAAALVTGVFVGEQAHLRSRDRKAEAARQQFETAMRVTDRALDPTRASLQRVGLALGD